MASPQRPIFELQVQRVPQAHLWGVSSAMRQKKPPGGRQDTLQSSRSVRRTWIWTITASKSLPLVEAIKRATTGDTRRSKRTSRKLNVCSSLARQEVLELHLGRDSFVSTL